jgi:hypothetical protein
MREEREKKQEVFQSISYLFFSFFILKIFFLFLCGWRTRQLAKLASANTLHQCLAELHMAHTPVTDAALAEAAARFTVPKEACKQAPNMPLRTMSEFAITT